MGLIFKKSTAQPAFTVAAAITGTTEATQTLTCAYTVVRARTANVTCRWYRHTADDGTDPTGVLLGTGTTYVLTGTDVGNYIRAIVTAINPAGTVQSTTAYTAVITSGDPPEPPALVTPAAITISTVEGVLTAEVTYAFTGESSVAIQWYSYATEDKTEPVLLGTSSTQDLTGIASDRWIGVTVVATNAVDDTETSAIVPLGDADPYAPIAPAQYTVPAYDDSTLRKVYCYAGDDLQAKLNNLMPGECLVLEAGATWTRLQHTIPNTNLGVGARAALEAAEDPSFDKWAYIVSSSLVDLPAEGERVDASDAANMPKIRLATFVNSSGQTRPGGDDGAEALNIKHSVSKLRIVGVEIDSAYDSLTYYNEAMVHIGRLETGETWLGAGEDVVLDRCYIHGSPNSRSRDGVVIYNGINKVAIIGCLLDYFAGQSLESHAISNRFSCAPLLIHNNTIRAASINILLCDSLPDGDPAKTITPTPADITITKNLIEKRAEWCPDDPTWDGINHNIKNLIESKGSHRVLVEGNVLHRCPNQSQPGLPFYVSPVGGTGCSDVDIKNNLIVDVGSFGFANDGDAGRGYGFERIRIANNLYYKMRSNVYQFRCGGLSTGFGRYVDVRNNSFIITNRTSAGLMVFGLATPTGMQYFKFQDNICQGGSNFIKGTGVAAGETSLDYHVDDYTFTSNVIVGVLSTLVNTSDASWQWYRQTSYSGVGFVNTAFTELGHFALDPASAYYTAATDGGPIGCDVSALIAAINASDVPTLG